MTEGNDEQVAPESRKGRLPFAVTASGGVTSLQDLPALCCELEALGVDSIWAGEVNFLDAMTTMAVSATHTEELGIGCIVPYYGRPPAVLALAIASVASAGAGRTTIGLGSSSRRMVEQWYGVPWERPVQRASDILRFLRRALDGSRVVETYETFAVDGFRIAQPPRTPPPLLLAALRPVMLGVARDEADGAVTNWLAPGDVRTVRAVLGDRARLAGMVYVYPTPEPIAREELRQAVCPLIANYLSVPTYAAYERWLGRAAPLEQVWEANAQGRHADAATLVPDDVIDDLIVVGTPAECRARLGQYRDEGLDLPVLVFLNPGFDEITSTRLLAAVT